MQISQFLNTSPAPPSFLCFGQILLLKLFCVDGDSSHEEVVKLLSGKVLDVFWRSNGEGGALFGGGKVGSLVKLN